MTVDNRTTEKIPEVLALGDPMSCRELVSATGLSGGRVYAAVYRCWRAQLVLRTEEAIYEHESVYKGRAGRSPHTRLYHLYVLRRGDGVGPRWL